MSEQLKLISKPSFNPDSFRYVISCLWCTSFNNSTDFISMITSSFINKSIRYPPSNRTFSYTTGNGTWLLTCKLALTSSYSNASWYADSNKSAPRALYTLNTAPRITYEISFSVILKCINKICVNPRCLRACLK